VLLKVSTKEGRTNIKITGKLNSISKQQQKTSSLVFILRDCLPTSNGYSLGIL